MSEDTGWLIEHPHDPRYGRASWYSGKDGFTIDSLHAVRFARKEDAVREIDRFQASLAKSLIAAQHSWIPARVCAHGQLARQCEICEAQGEAAHWRAKAEDSFEPIRKIADALAEGGFHCHDKPGFVADHVPSLVNEAVTELKINREAKERLTVALENEKVRRERAVAAATDEIVDLRMRLKQRGDWLEQIGESLRHFGHSPLHEGQWPILVKNALVELDRRTRQRTSDPNLLVEIVATPDDASVDSEWILLHSRLKKFLVYTGERGLKNLLGTVTMLRDRLLDVGDEVLSEQLSKPQDGCFVPPPSRVAWAEEVDDRKRG